MNELCVPSLLRHRGGGNALAMKNLEASLKHAKD